LRDLSLPAVAKQVLVDRGVLAHPDVRPPLRELTDDERTRVASL
jgi:dihydrodipicolinate synthase/N-acetylneuraminate lyase